MVSDIGKAQPLVGVMGYTDEESGLERGRPQVRTQNPQIQGILDNFSGGVGYTGNTPGDDVMVMPDYGPNPVSGHNSGQADKDAYDAYLREKDEKDRAKGIYGVKNYKGTRQKSRFGTAYGGYGLPRMLVGEGDNSKLHPTTIANKFRDTKHYLNQRPKTKPETKDRIQMSGDDPFELAMSVLKNAADYDVDMSNPISVESLQNDRAQCSKCGNYGANMRQTFADKFGMSKTTRDVCENCFGSR